MALKTIRALAFCSAALAIPVAAQAAPASANASYQALVKNYFDTQWQLHPTAATATGLHNWDDRIDDVSAAAHAKEVTILKDLKAKLLAVDGSKLSLADRDDRDVLVGEIDRTLLEDETVQLWRHDPGTYVNILTYAAFQLIERDFAPLPERMKNTIARDGVLHA
ncbi:MAG TPA: DUF885 family protein, partial [Rhizomicrobium sp.]|nr:DUF885 family protein [Rhizomicrobium sp.]